MSKYAESHKHPQGPGDERPTAMQIIQDEQLEGALKDKVILLVGASAGIGVETGRALAATGARVFLGARNLPKVKKACASFLGPGRVDVLEIDTSSLASVRRAAEELQAKTSRLNLIVNNAAIMACPESKSVDGFELQLATNYLGIFLLYTLLEPLLLQSATKEWPSRVVNVSSSAHHESDVHLDNINLEGAYTPIRAYGQSKTAMIHMANQIERLHGKENLHGISLMPGGIMTNLQQFFPDDVKAGWTKNEDVQKILKSEEQGAATTVLAAVGREWKDKGALYLEDCQAGQHFENPPKIGARGYAKHAFDESREQQLWTLSHKLVA